MHHSIECLCLELLQPAESARGNFFPTSSPAYLASLTSSCSPLPLLLLLVACCACRLQTKATTARHVALEPTDQKMAKTPPKSPISGQNSGSWGNIASLELLSGSVARGGERESCLYIILEYVFVRKMRFLVNNQKPGRSQIQKIS